MVALCDLVPDVLNSLGDELGVDPSKRFDDLDEMMVQAQPDIVAIPVATELHYSLWCARPSRCPPAPRPSY